MSKNRFTKWFLFSLILFALSTGAMYYTLYISYWAYSIKLFLIVVPLSTLLSVLSVAFGSLVIVHERKRKRVFHLQNDGSSPKSTFIQGFSEIAVGAGGILLCFFLFLYFLMDY
ncbi:hypothetical protein PNF31_12040 [Priestia megaterium]|uniref:hypothetical protein n=1 Tax=Priestia megaterium TaxID=1404 RepID=UPI00234E7FAF|nr:hypothetical protein [Priestia megaterium]MDC7721538.1 hypothetical protein [Priestia megaterium]